MNKNDFESMQRGIAQAQAYLAGERDDFALHEPVAVRSIRKQKKLTRKAVGSSGRS